MGPKELFVLKRSWYYEDVCEESFYGIAVAKSFLEYARLIFC